MRPGAVDEVVNARVVNSSSTIPCSRRRAVTDAKGVATFRTIYPGWYPGRTPHIHVKVSVAGSEVHTGQLFFDEALTTAVYARDPYRARGAQDTTSRCSRSSRGRPQASSPPPSGEPQ